ncbi:hypothetical protein F5Y13DRAFT_193383 [Hypoxylon sp. FL1857]|nr:hypothetical protein F5Y13DRAFT_193383 [Hypoxylon sp. FL1857]
MPPNSRYKLPYDDHELRDLLEIPKSNLCHGPRLDPTTKIRGDPWQSVSALQLGLRPRPFHEAHTERMYLLEMLQQYDKRATELFALVPVIEERVRSAESSDMLRQAKKLRGWLRHRIVDTVEEEKKTLARLSEIHVEIQCRERWARVEKEREMRSLGWLPQNPGYASFPVLQQPQAQTCAQTNLQCPNLSPYYPSDMYPELRNSQHDEPGSMYEGDAAYYAWEPETPATRLNTPEASPEPEIFELDGTAIDDASVDASDDFCPSLEAELGIQRPTRRSSMPALNRKWSW